MATGLTGGCLIFLVLLIVIGGSLLAALWYRLWSTENTTNRNRAAAEVEHRERIDRAARESAQALRASAATDPATLTALIGKHTRAPVITYNATHKEFTAKVEMSTIYDTAHLLTVGVERIVSCEVFTYTPGPDRAWRVDLTTRETATCRPGKQIGDLAHRARQVLENLNGDLMTVAEAQRVLDQARSPGRLIVRNVTHDKRTTTVSALLADATKTVGQCYRLTMSRPGNQVPSPATATPTSLC